MPSAWRIVQRKFARKAFDGEGARVNGGRWNSAGTPLVYLSTSQALAVLEILVHLHDADSLRAEYVLFEVVYADEHRRALPRAEWPRGWNASPPAPGAAAVGDAWCARAHSLLLAVPSAILPEEENLLLNPRHPAFGELSIRGPRALPIDPRLVRRT